MNYWRMIVLYSFLSSGFLVTNVPAYAINWGTGCVQTYQDWVIQQEILLDIEKGKPFFLPRGRFEIEAICDGQINWVIEAPVLMAPVTSTGKIMHLNIPLPSRRVVCHWQPSSVLTLPVIIRYLGSEPLPEIWRKWYPVNPDPRFHELDFPGPFPGYLYRLDTNSYKPEPDGFWIKGKSTAQFIILSSRDIHFLEFRLSSIIDNTITIHQGSGINRFQLKKNCEAIWSFHPETAGNAEFPSIYPFTVHAEKGLKPSTVDLNSSDSRNLGVFIRTNNQAIDPRWFHLVSGASQNQDQLAESIFQSLNMETLKPWLLLTKFNNTQLHSSQKNILHKMLKYKQQSLKPLYSFFPDSISDEFIQQIIHRIHAGYLLKECSWLYDQANRLGLAGDSAWNETIPIKNFQPVQFNRIISCYGSEFDYDHETRTIAINLWWKTDTIPSEDYKIFIHLVPKNQTKLQWLIQKMAGIRTGKSLISIDDHYPLNGDLMTTEWVLGMKIHEKRLITIPDHFKKGDYDVCVGLYNPLTGNRSKTDQNQSWISIGALTIQDHETD